MRVFWLPALLVAGIYTSGCATVVKGTDQPVAVNTPGAEGALCELNSPTIGTYTVKTPGTSPRKSHGGGGLARRRTPDWPGP